MASTDGESIINTIVPRNSLDMMEKTKKTRRVHAPHSSSRTGRSASWTPMPPLTKASRISIDNVASYMASSPHHSGTLLRRFDKVNFKNLLVMEREIAGLEVRLEMEEGKQHVDEGLVKQIEEELSDRVRVYYKAVLLTKEMLALSRPSERNLTSVRRAFPPSFGQSTAVLSKFHNAFVEDDLSTLSPESDPDFLTRTLERVAEGKNVAHSVTFISAIFAIIFLVGAMIGLYFVSNVRIRLGMIVMFTVLFAGMIAIGGDGKRSEVFVGTAAYAAVLVVFVSGNIAADPIPTVCGCEDRGNTNNAANAQNTAGWGSPTNAAVSAVTYTATAVQTVTSFGTESVRTIVNTVTSTSTPQPAVVKKEMSDLAKAGIGVGVAVGLLFCLMVLTAFISWVREHTWVGKGGVFSIFSRNKKKRNVGWTRGRGAVMEEKTTRAVRGREPKNEVAHSAREARKAEKGTQAHTNDRHSVWV